MTLVPLNGHVEIKPVEQDGIIRSVDGMYEEKGAVLSIAPDVVGPIEIGDYIYFDSWMSAKFYDGKGETHYLVPYESIRAYEPISKQ